MTNMRSKQQGLTLVELMVTLAVAIILITVGMPLFTGLAGSNRATTQANSLVSALKLARSEAVKRADSVTVCSDNGAGACGDETEWVNGWLVHTDVNESGGFDAGDVLRTWDPLAPSSTVTVAEGSVTFFATGEANNTFSFELDDSEASGSAADAAKRCVEVTATGQVRSKRWDPDVAWSCP
jgi:type IV fimbrial biogenesis protein FimT